MRLLLIGNSYSFGLDYLDHVALEIQDFLPRSTRVLFFPFAVHNTEDYLALVSGKFGSWGYEVSSLHTASNPRRALLEADAIFVGGGNTFRLLKALYDGHLLAPLRQKVRDGVPYIGSSAGTNIACPTIRTTNDMPIVFPPSLDALDLVRVQINPHYLDWDSNCRVEIESREKRILEYHEENNLPVLGLRDGCYIRIEDESALLKGRSNARLFRKSRPPIEIVPIADISEVVLRAASRSPHANRANPSG
jgi:dipeptidase E